MVSSDEIDQVNANRPMAADGRYNPAWSERMAWGAPTHPQGRLDANMIVWGMTYIGWWKRMRGHAG